MRADQHLTVWQARLYVDITEPEEVHRPPIYIYI
jgi:hypothetical protein